MSNTSNTNPSKDTDVQAETCCCPYQEYHLNDLDYFARNKSSGKIALRIEKGEIPIQQWDEELRKLGY